MELCLHSSVRLRGVVLTVYHLCKDTVIRSDYVTWNGRMITE
jgi:hypothetical protein